MGMLLRGPNVGSSKETGHGSVARLRAIRLDLIGG